MEIVYRAAFVFVFLWLITRVVGRSTLGELSTFQLILFITVGDMIQQAITTGLLGHRWGSGRLGLHLADGPADLGERAVAEGTVADPRGGRGGRRRRRTRAGGDEGGAPVPGRPDGGGQRPGIRTILRDPSGCAGGQRATVLFRNPGRGCIEPTRHGLRWVRRCPIDRGLRREHRGASGGNLVPVRSGRCGEWTVHTCLG